MPKYVVYEVWTAHKIIEAKDDKEAYEKGDPTPRPESPELNLSNWHIVKLPEEK